MPTPVISNIDNTKHTYSADGVNYGLNPTTQRFEVVQSTPQASVPAFDPSQTQNTPGLNTYKGPATITTNPVTETTIAQAYSDEYSPYGAGFKSAAETPIDENAIRQQKLSESQAEIDAVNRIYADKLARARQQGIGRLGESGAIQARRGLLGSDFGTAQTEQVRTYNTGIESDIENEKAMALAGIYSKIKTDATNEIAAKRAAKEAGVSNYLEFLKGEGERKTKRVSDAVAQMIASNIGKDQIESIAKESGLSVADLTKQYDLKRYETKQAEAKRQQELADKIAAKGIETISEGQAGYRLNPKTGQYELVASRAKTYAPSRTSSGVGIDSNGNEIQISEQAQNIVDLINKNGGGIAQVNDLIKGSSREAQALRNEVYAGIKAQGGRTTGDTSAIMNNLNLVNKILENPGVISGPVQTGSIPFTAGATIRNQYNQLKGILALDNRQKLKGSGAISDFESRTLERAASSLGRNQSEAEFTKNLKDVRGVFQTAAGMKANVKVTTPNGQVDIGELSRDEINSAIEQGYTVEYQ